MAKFLDERHDDADLEEGEELTTFEEDSEDDVEASEDSDQADTEAPEIPDKYQGKSIQDIIAMHQNAEQLLGRQGQEVGELRKVVDDFIKAQTVKSDAHSGSTETVDDDLDFFENPKASINKMLENHPALQETRQVSQELKKNETLAKIKATHPDFMQIIQDQKFADWIEKSKIRQNLLVQADKNYDYEAANELLSLWKERQGAISTTVESEKKARKQSVKTASTGAAKGSGERPSRKIYRRADIIDLMRKDPDRYEALAPEIRRAYAEGRVK